MLQAGRPKVNSEHQRREARRIGVEVEVEGEGEVEVKSGQRSVEGLSGPRSVRERCQNASGVVIVKGARGKINEGQECSWRYHSSHCTDKQP